MKNIKEWLKGKKTYIVAIVTLILGFLQAFDIFVMPDAGWPILAAIFGISLRAGVDKAAQAAKGK